MELVRIRKGRISLPEQERGYLLSCVEVRHIGPPQKHSPFIPSGSVSCQKVARQSFAANGVT